LTYVTDLITELTPGKISRTNVLIWHKPVDVRLRRLVEEASSGGHGAEISRRGVCPLERFLGSAVQPDS